MKLKRLRQRRLSLRARLTLTYGGLFFVAGLLLLGVTYVLFDQQLAQRGQKFLAITKSDPSGERTTVAPQPPNAVRPEDRLISPDMDRFLKAERDKLHDAAVTSLVTQGGLALVAVGGLAVGFGWLIAGRMLAPLHKVTDTARRIASAPAADHNLHERIALRGPNDEVKELADTFDTMVERLDRSFDGQRRFVANASHELRTPLTLGRALVEVAMHRKTASPDVIQLGETLLEINSRHERLIGGLLLLARSENEITDRAPVDLADVVGHVTAQTAREAAHAEITVREEPGEALTSGDALLLERLVQNLVENGIRHNSGPGGWVEVTSRADAGQVELTVSNSGPAVPPYEIPALFEPFHRFDSDRLVTPKGAGLGLSIVRSIVGAHSGRIAASPRPGGGLVVTVTLPACPPDTREALRPDRQIEIIRS
ncbi:sensor histidine kinase [Actinomadura rudentiformis]|uniref:histidine kinase n=1 Tax=Actinomadura rudentiformis TaxID=359158 RepID=A0A6H9Z1T5_9ACTN|nr:HAMP domain-containing sensor histidine kinase [Actinomadura rudentiformis]KAB2350743.1 HAMP domain-containing histidine kinase [Actinomadura rudentiformis]